ncbi:MAG: hypothetical protein R2825_29910 [Saprospiraceae bacterium]
MKKRIPAIILLAFSLLAILSIPACKKEHLPDETIYFQEDIFPVIVTSCTQSGCHNATDREQGYDLTNYQGILEIVKPGDYKGSELYKSLVKPLGYMPENADRLSDDVITSIALWIEQGALDNSSGGSGCNTDNVTYGNTVTTIIATWCYACHAGSNPVGLIRLDSYAAVKAAVNDGKLLGTIRHDAGFKAMPDGGGKLPDCDIEQIEKWVNDGALDN